MPQILLVEDDATIGEGTKDYLESMGNHQVTWLTHGDEAKAVLSQPHHFDCVILDLNLLGAPGLDVLKALRGWDQKTPVIITTANDFAEVKNQCMQAGATDFLGKPVWLSTLSERINVCLPESSGTPEGW